MAEIDKPGSFFLGRPHDISKKKTDSEPLLYDSKDLTTHAVCVGMTGSGKTGLCLALLEEAALNGIPAIAIDPKGDLGNSAARVSETRAGRFSAVDRRERSGTEEDVAGRIRGQPGRAVAQRARQLGRRAGPHPPLLRCGRSSDLYARLERGHSDHRVEIVFGAAGRARRRCGCVQRTSFIGDIGIARADGSRFRSGPRSRAHLSIHAARHRLAGRQRRRSPPIDSGHQPPADREGRRRRFGIVLPGERSNQVGDDAEQPARFAVVRRLDGGRAARHSANSLHAG